MTVRPEDWPRIKELFERARAQAPGLRETFVDQACAGDEPLRQEIDSLLAASDQASGFLETPASPAFAAVNTGGLLAGRRVGPYELSTRIGAGGMGEVYKARDTRLDRTVAIKVLSARVATDPQAHERFEREARAVAALNHPHICTLHDVGSQDGLDFLVMEFLEGETLAARLHRGPLGVADALEYGCQIASALDKANRAGIVHRDLKPGNVMLTKGGTKLLDFGLAKQRPAAVSGGPGTPGDDLTGPGVILGTAQYMAPEQLEGKDADARTDLFAFGAVLYEMLTGKRAFDEPSDAKLVAAIMSAQPRPITQLRSDAPPEVEYAIGRCLAKDPDDRWQTARDLLAELQRIKDGSASDRSSIRGRGADRQRARFAGGWGAAALATVAVIAAVTIAFPFLPRSTAHESPIWLSILPPPDGFDLSPDPAVSPDGRYVAYKAQDASHETHIWLKALDSPTANPIPGTDGTDYTGAHFWSPDSRSIGFFANGKLKRIDINGGTPQVLASAPEPRGGTWSPSGVILFNADTQNLMRISASGGSAVPVAEPSSGGVRLFPHALADGSHYLFTSRNAGGQGLGVYVGSLDDAGIRRISDAWSPAIVASGHLLFARQRALFAQPFDAGRLEVSGEPHQIANGVGLSYGTPLSYAFSASATGSAAYWSGIVAPDTQLAWIDRTGKRIATVGDPGAHNGFTLAGDGRRAVMERIDPTTNANDIWLLDPTSRAGPSRITANGPFSAPVLSTDGRRLALMERGRGLVVRSLADGTTETLVSGNPQKTPSDWSRDGRWIAFMMTMPGGHQLWTTTVQPDSQAKLYREAPFTLTALAFSPDNRWVAYVSDESGQFEVYVDSYPSPDQRIRASTGGGRWPKWRLDGRELYYLARDRKLMAVSVQPNEKGVTVSAPVVLFEAPAVGSDWSRTQYVPSPDGSTFLFNARVESHAPVGLTVISNWPALLKK